MRPMARYAPAAVAAILAAACLAPPPAGAVEPIKIGFTEELTGSLALNGKQALLAINIWAEDVNAKGGLLGRPVQLVYYDDQSNPSLVPAIYTKLIEIDKVDLLYAQGTNISSPAMPTIIEHKKMLMDSFSLAVNEQFKYSRFFQTMPYGPDGKESISRGFFEVAMTMIPKPKTVALLGADAEFSKSALEGARKQVARLGLNTVYDRTYPPATVDYAPIVRAIKAAEPDLIFAGSYPADTAGIVRAMQEIGVDAMMFGGAMVGLQAGTIKAQFGDQLNGIVTYELFVHEKTMSFPGIEDFLKKYQSRAAASGVDPLGYYIPPFTYATFEILGRAVQAVGSLDEDKLAAYIHQATFKTIVGDIKFGPDGEWATPRMLTIQYQNLKGHDLAQFTEPGTQVILDPPEFKSGTLQYPYSKIKH